MLFVAGVFVILGIMFLGIITVCKNYYNNIFKRCTMTVTGSFAGVSRHNAGNDVRNMDSYYPVYRYLVNNQEYYCQGKIGSYNKNVDVKETSVIIHYNPNDPKESYIDKKEIELVIMIFEILGSCFLIAGIVLLIIHFLK